MFSRSRRIPASTYISSIWATVHCSRFTAPECWVSMITTEYWFTNFTNYWSIMIRYCIDEEYLVVASKWLAFHCRVVDFCSARQPQGWDSLDVLFGHCEWAFVKLTCMAPLGIPGVAWSRGSGCVSTMWCSACRCWSRANSCQGTVQIFLRSGLSFLPRHLDAYIFYVLISLDGWNAGGYGPGSVCGTGVPTMLALRA